MENNENKNKIITTDYKSLLVIALMTLIGAFLAFYVLMHQIIIPLIKPLHPFPITNEKTFDKIEKEIENDFEQMKKGDISKFKNKVSAVQTLKYEDAYIIVINLKPFNNNEENIRFSLNGNIATVSGNVIKSKRNGENSYYFTESFEIPEKIDISDIQKEKINGKYIITLPIEN